MFFDSNTQFGVTNDGSTMVNYQYRLGGRYYPGAPVQMSLNAGSHYSNGGSESKAEMEKFLNTVGDYRLQPNVNVLNWAIPAIINQNYNLLPEYDYSYLVAGYNAYGIPNMLLIENATSCTAGNMPSSCYANCINFETSNGVEISGLNAEEQSDIAYVVQWSAPQNANFVIECYTFCDKMLVLRPNNVLEVIE